METTCEHVDIMFFVFFTNKRLKKWQVKYVSIMEKKENDHNYENACLK